MVTTLGKVQVSVDCKIDAANNIVRTFDCLNAAMVFADALGGSNAWYTDAKITQNTYFYNVLTGQTLHSTRYFYLDSEYADVCEFHAEPANGDPCNLVTLFAQDERNLRLLEMEAETA